MAGASVPPPSAGTGLVQAGVLTAGAWDDNENFDRFTKYRSAVAQAGSAGLPPFINEEHQAAQQSFSGARPARVKLDIALVIDTTGSMADEIAYLQAEFLAISRAIQDRYPAAAQRWALVVYRDDGDEYVARWFDFRDDPEDFRSHLAKQAANGGGDFPEAVDKGLEAMNGLGWRSGNDVARLAFWVADAPHHDSKAGAVASAVRVASERGVHIYPVASSGINELTELTMRSAAQLTGGRYLFLTNDSGVGGDHKEPTIPCYFVTRLDRAILRMVDIELTGTYREPTTEEVIRTGGNPQDGVCRLGSGEVLEVF